MAILAFGKEADAMYKPLTRTLNNNQSDTTASGSGGNSAVFSDNRPEAVAQRKLQHLADAASGPVIQLGKKNKRKDDEEEEYVPPSAKKKHRVTFSARHRVEVIRRTALRNKHKQYVCPACGRPLANKKGKEIKTYYISKKKGRKHYIKSAQLDHYPPWNKRLLQHEKRKSSPEEIRADYLDPKGLRALCLRCNASHKHEGDEELPEDGYSDQEYFSDDEERDKEIWSKHRKDDEDDGKGPGAVSA